MLPNTSATIFNKATDLTRDETSYERTILPEVHWEDGVSVSGKSKNHAASRGAFIAIDFSASDSCGKQYVQPHEYAALDASARSSCWTIAPDDIIIKGTIGEDIPSGGFRQWMAAHPEAAAVASVETFDMGSGRMQHWEVYAK